MNQEKIGKYISELRKEKGMTQVELAEKLGITDRAISKWENGRGMPDISLIVPLCEILDISINELLSGERLKEKDYPEKAEKNIIDTIDYTDKKIKKTKKIFLIIIVAILLLVVACITMFYVDINRMRNNKPVIFSTWGFSYMPPLDIKEVEIENAVEEYLLDKAASDNKYHENVKDFVGMRVYLLEGKEEHSKYNVYAWVLEERYYLESGKIEQASGASMPYKFVVENIDDKFVVTDSRVPRDGSYYAQDMENIFPLSVRRDMEEVYTDGTQVRLSQDIQRQAMLYFHLNQM